MPGTQATSPASDPFRDADVAEIIGSRRSRNFVTPEEPALQARSPAFQSKCSKSYSSPVRGLIL